MLLSNQPDQESAFSPTGQPSEPCAGTESGSWSHSKRWVSEETKERNSLTRLTANLRHIGADKSPFIPQSMSQLAALKAEIAEDERKALQKKVARRQAELTRKKSPPAEDSAPVDAKIGKLLGGRELDHMFSPVLSSRNCFNAHRPQESHFRVDWPSLAELKEAGERGRLPVPRMNQIDPQLAEAAQGNIFNPDGSIRWQVKAPLPQSHFILPVSPPQDW